MRQTSTIAKGLFQFGVAAFVVGSLFTLGCRQEKNDQAGTQKAVGKIAPGPSVVKLPSPKPVSRDGPETMSGRWVVESYTVDGKEIGDTNPLPQGRIGTLWKLHVDGTGEILGYKQRWTYDKMKRNFTLSQEGILFGFSEWITDADVTLDGKKIVIKDAILGKPIVITLKPGD